MSHNNFFFGTSGLVLPFPKREFPEQYNNSSRLTFYATLNNSIEINSSFYRLPMASTVKKWVHEVPHEFRFTFKMWREITHIKGLEFKEIDIEKFMAVINQAEAKAGCLLIQLPPSLQINALPKLDKLFGLVEHYNINGSWNIAIEFRHKSWYQDNVCELLSKRKISLVIHDMPASATPMISTSDRLVYLRFHGPDGSYKGSYGESFLSEYAQYIQEWLNEGKQVYAYFNNTAGDALNNLNYLKRCVSTGFQQH